MELKHNCGICLFCGKDLQNNAAEVPDCMKVISLSLEAYSQQKTILEGPELYLCHKCSMKVAINAAKHAQLFNDLQ
jgi:hypothetical protein